MSRPPIEGWLLPADAALAPRAARAARRLEALGVRVVARDSSGYPASLNEVESPLGALFVRGGELPDPGQAVAIVGSRAASPYGTSVAGRLATDLARLGLTVVSGLARGIDAAAHRGALEAGGATVAVLPSGHDRITPAHHAELAEAIARQGTLVTERGFGGPRFRGEFVARNRLIAALAGVTVVVEAAVRSGALSTAAVAERLGRPRLAVPGDVDRDTARGCHALIRRGALLCECAADVVRALEDWRRRAAPRDASVKIGRSRELRLLEALDDRPRPLEQVARAAGLDVPEALAGLLALQWSGGASPRPGQRWVRTSP